MNFSGTCWDRHSSEDVFKIKVMCNIYRIRWSYEYVFVQQEGTIFAVLSWYILASRNISFAFNPALVVCRSVAKWNSNNTGVTELARESCEHFPRFLSKYRFIRMVRGRIYVKILEVYRGQRGMARLTGIDGQKNSAVGNRVTHGGLEWNLNCNSCLIALLWRTLGTCWRIGPDLNFILFHSVQSTHV